MTGLPPGRSRRPFRATRLAVGLLIAAASWMFTADAAAQTLPTLSISAANVNEGDSGSTNMQFTLTLSASSSQDVTVSYADAGTGTATSGTDYTAITGGTITLLAGATSTFFNVSVTGDTVHEPNESVVVTLSSPTNAAFAGGATTISATGWIRDDEPQLLSISSPTVTEGDSGSTNMTFTVSRTVALSQRLRVFFEITGGTATSGTDYTALTNNRVRLNFSPNQRSRTATISVRGDTLDEDDETIEVGLGGLPLGWTGGTGTGTITDDDDPPVLSISGGSVTEGNTGSASLTFTATLDAASGKQVTVNYADAGTGTATSGTDYTALTAGTLTFAAEETSKTITVSATGDTLDEPDETVVVSLSSPTNATVSATAGSGTGTITDDDEQPRLRFTGETVREGDSGTVSMTFTATLVTAGNAMGVSGKQVTVDYADAGTGVATSGTDYTALTAGTLTIAAGDSSATITVSVRGDTEKESHETVVVQLSNPTNAAFLSATGDSATGTIRDDDNFPVANAGPDQRVNEGDTVTLSGSGHDPDGDPVTSWRWDQTAGPMVTLTGRDTATASFTAPTGLALDEVMRFSLTVGAGHEGSGDSVDITVDAANPTWTTNAGPDQTVDEGDTVTLSGSGPFPAPQGVGRPTYSWSHTGGGRSTVTLTGASTATPSFTVPNLTADDTLTITLTMTVGDDSRTDTVDVAVRADDDDPTANAGGNQAALGGDTVSLDGSRSFDPEDETLSYSWSQTAGQPDVTLTGEETATASFTAPNLTTIATLTFTLTVTAGGGSDTDVANVTILPPGAEFTVGARLTANAGLDQVVLVGTNVDLDGSRSTVPLYGGVVGYSWRQTAGPTVTLTGPTSGTPSFTAPNLTETRTLTFSLTVTAGESSATDTVNIVVTPETETPGTPGTPGVNRPPEISIGTAGDRTYMQGERITPFTIAVSDPDGDVVEVEVVGLPPGLRHVDGRVEGTVAAHAAARVHLVTVTAYDGVAAPVRATFTVTVTEDQRPSFGSASVPAQRYRIGSEIDPLTLPAATGGDGPLRYALTPHVPAPGLVYTTPGSAGTSTGGVIAGVPTAAQGAVRCTLTATDADGDTATLTFTVEVRSDLQPSFDEVAPVSRQYRAGRPAGGPALPAAEGGDPPLRYDLAPAPPAGLRFDGVSRTLTGTPTAEQRPAPWTLTVTDADGDTATLEVTISVLDPPVVTSLRLVSQPAAGDTYGHGEAIALELTFSEPVEVTGAPTLGKTVGSAVRTARLTSADGSRLRFEYQVSGTDLDEDGVSVSADALALGGGRITDAAGTAAELGHAGLADHAGHRVDGRPRAVGTLRTVTVMLGGAPARVDLSGAFRGVETYAAAVADGSLAAVEVDGSSAVVTALAEGTTTVTVTGRNAGGATEQRFGVVVATSVEEHEVMVSTLAGVGRSFLAGAASTVGRRLDRRGGGTRAQASLAGRMLPLGSGLAAASGGTAWMGPAAGPAPAPQSGRLTGEELLFGSAFTFSGGGTGPATAEAGSGADGGLRWTAWGAGGRQSFQGTAGLDSTYDGRPATAAAGVDVERGRLLAGVAVARSVADATYAFRDAAGGASGQGELSTRLVTAQPYARWLLDDRTSVWGVFGAGRGRAALARSVSTAAESADLAVLMGLGGVRRELGSTADWDLALRGDVGGVWLDTDAGGGLLAEQRVAVYQSRLGLEIGRAFETGWRNGLAVRPFAAVSGRYDGGAGASGTGLEVAGGLRAADGAGRIEVEASGRVLALRTASGYRERGASVRARLTPGGNAGRGLSVELTPRWGAPGIGADTLWQDQTLGAAAGIGGLETGSLDARVGYRLGLLAPFAEMGWARQDAQRQRLGLRVGEVGDAVDVEVTGERRTSIVRPSNYRFTLIGRIEFRPW